VIVHGSNPVVFVGLRLSSGSSLADPWDSTWRGIRRESAQIELVYIIKHVSLF